MLFRSIPSAFITHQLYIKSPFGEKLLKKINKFFIEKHLECWIPDFDNPQKALSGELSHPGDLTSNIKFIGPLSRFSNKYELVNNKYELLVILSGPEPQRSIFEKLILNQLQTIDVKTLVVLGNPSLHKNKKIGKIEIINHLPTEKLQIAINQSEIVLARSGYTTVMDLASLGKKAILIPTPGQTEQQYLGELHMHKGNCVIGKQKSFSLKIGRAHV